MAAVFALVFVPALAATLFMLGGAAHDGWSVTNAAVAIGFLALATGMVVGLFRLSRQWDDEEST